MASTAAQRRVGPYELVAPLGSGGMAETYVAVRRGPGGFTQRVCLKRLRPELERDPDFVRQFMAEAAIAARLRHAAIAQVLDFGRDESGGDYYLALELIDGCDLRELLEASGGTLPHALVLHVAIELCTALDFAHRAGDSADAAQPAVVHRDVSPSNTLISREGEVKLTDFGIARSVGGAQHTRTGIVKGKVPYMAPEYARSGRLDPRGDLFSLGVLLYECLSGARPHDGATDLETLERAVRGERLRLAERAHGAPPALVEIVEQLLEPDPQLRQQSAAEVLEALLLLPPPARARLELGARVSAIARSRVEQAATVASAAGPAPTEVMPVAAEVATVAAVPVPAVAPAPTGSQSFALPLNRFSRAPVLALGGAILFALGVLAFALLRTPHARSEQRAPAASAPIAATAPVELELPPPEAAPTPTPVVIRSEPETAATGDRAWLEVVVLPYGQVSVDGRPFRRAPCTLELAPGEHAIEARSEGNALTRRVTLAAGEHRRVLLR